METSSKPEDKEEKPERSFKEQRIRDITFIYYSRADVKKAIFEFSKNRECVPRYFEGFGKRPDSFQYESDILEHVRRGATSFHCSEELWTDPLEISTELSKKELDELRVGWDLILDIDSPYLEYSKTYAEILVKVLKKIGIENIGIKYSGSKGFHVVIPWKAFPKEVYGQKTKDMFPEWPRIICQYLAETLKKDLDDELYERYEKGGSLKDIAEKMGKQEEDLIGIECLSCHKPSIKKELVTWICPNCKNELTAIRKNRRIPKCPNESCRKIMAEKSSREIYSCEFCNIDSIKNSELFKKIVKLKHIEADLILVAPRHLFRMPYSLHEKTALASIVIDKDKIKDFQITDAKPFKIGIKNYYPQAKEGEAKMLLLQALDWNEQREKQEKIMDNKKHSGSKFQESGKSGEPYKKISIPNPSNEILPPCIKLILNGMKQDGRKRALFVLINFFKSLGLNEGDLEKKIYEWNEKNAVPLKKGYIQSQLNWYRRNKTMLPQNCSNPIYKDIGVCRPEELCRIIKNPVNYSFKMYFKNRR